MKVVTLNFVLLGFIALLTFIFWLKSLLGSTLPDLQLFFVGLNNLLMAYEDKSAYALCAFSFALSPEAEPVTFLGKTPVCFSSSKMPDF